MNTHDKTELSTKGQEILGLVDTIIASVNGVHHARSEEWRDGCFQAADETYEKIKTELAAIEAIIHPEVSEFELIQDDIPVAGSFGPREEAWREIQHYAAQYSEDGPVEIYEITRRRIEGES